MVTPIRGSWAGLMERIVMKVPGEGNDAVLNSVASELRFQDHYWGMRDGRAAQ